MSSQNYVFQDNQHDTEHIRLSAIQDEFDPDSCRRLSQIGIAAGWSALEVGAGMGSIMSWMAEQVSVQGKVVAVDINTRFIKNTNLPNVEVRCLDIAKKKSWIPRASMYAMLVTYYCTSAIGKRLLKTFGNLLSQGVG